MKKIVCSFILLTAFHLSIVRSIATSSVEKEYYCFYVSGYTGSNIKNKISDNFCNVLISVNDVQGMSIKDIKKLWENTKIIPNATRVSCYIKASKELHRILGSNQKIGVEILKDKKFQDSEKNWLDVIKKMDRKVPVPLYKMEKESTDRWKAILQTTNDQDQLSRIPDLPSEIKLDKNTSSKTSSTDANSTFYVYCIISIVFLLGLMIHRNHRRKKGKSPLKHLIASEEKAKIENGLSLQKTALSQ